MVFCLLNPCQRAWAVRLVTLRPASHSAEGKGFHLFQTAKAIHALQTLWTFLETKQPPNAGSSEEESKGFKDGKKKKKRGFALRVLNFENAK